LLKYLKGRLVKKCDSFIILECGNYGLQVNFPNSSMSELGSVGNEVKVYTELYVKARENDGELVLYGFLTEKEHSLFKLLVTVNKIGPKLALGILTQLTYEQIIDAIINSNWKFLTRVNGLGKKTSERLVVELKDKVQSLFGAVSSDNTNIQKTDDLKDALLSLGIREQEINVAYKSFLKQ
jgi:Holliday junction DNA helicase RuvA